MFKYYIIILLPCNNKSTIFLLFFYCDVLYCYVLYYSYREYLSFSRKFAYRYRQFASIFLLLFIVDENTSNFRLEFTSVSVGVRRTSDCRVWMRPNKADV